MTSIPENFDRLSWIIVNLLGPVAAGLGIALLLRVITRGLILILALAVICSVIFWSAGFDVLSFGSFIGNTCGEWQHVLPGKIADNVILPLAIAAILVGFALGLVLERLLLSKCRT